MHELLYRELFTILVTEHAGHFRLVVKQQPVFVPVGQDVQHEPDPPEKLAGFDQGVAFCPGQDVLVRQAREGVHVVLAPGHPDQRLNIPESAGRGFYTGFQAGLGMGGFMVSCLLFVAFGVVEGLGWPYPSG